jgi:hypothetical protein
MHLLCDAVTTASGTACRLHRRRALQIHRRSVPLPKTRFGARLRAWHYRLPTRCMPVTSWLGSAAQTSGAAGRRAGGVFRGCDRGVVDAQPTASTACAPWGGTTFGSVRGEGGTKLQLAPTRYQAEHSRRRRRRRRMRFLRAWASPAAATASDNAGLRGRTMRRSSQTFFAYFGVRLRASSRPSRKTFPTQ